MRASDRKRIADALTAIAIEHGATVDADATLYKRCIYVNVTFPDRVQCSFDVDDLHKGGFLFSFHSAQRPLRPCVVFGSVNPCHKRKATTYCDNESCAMEWWPIACRFIMTDEVFE